MRITKKRALIVIVLFSLISLIYFYSKQEKPAVVEFIELETRKVIKTVSATGKVTSKNTASLAFVGIGTINNISVEKGNSVNKGDFLGSINSSEAYFNSQSQKAAVDLAKKDLELFIEKYITNKKAIGGSNEYDVNVKRLEKAVDRAQAIYQGSLGSLSNYSIYAPFDGVILDVDAKLGEIASSTRPAFKIADLNNLILEIALDQEDFAFVEFEQKALINLDAYPDIEIEGEIVELPLFVDPDDTDNFVVKILITDSKNQKILLGMDADVKIEIDSSDDNVNALSFDQIYFDSEEKPFVWIAKNDLLEKQYIEIGLEGDIYTEVKSEIKSQIVIPEEAEVVEGQKIKQSNK